MNLSTLIAELTALLPVLGPGAPVLQHERLRISNDRDSVQVIDPDDKIESDLVKSLRQEIAELESIPSGEAEIEELQGQIERLKDERDEYLNDFSEACDVGMRLLGEIEDFCEEEGVSPSYDLKKIINEAAKKF